MSQKFISPLTPEQIKASQTFSDTKLRQTQEALFIYLINRVNELEAQIAGEPEQRLRVKNLHK